MEERENLPVRERADVIIIGGGLSGLCAAIEAREQGVKDVLILEKAKVTGGNGIFPDIMIAWDGVAPRLPCLDENRIKEGDPRIDPDPKVRADAVFRLTMDWNHWRGDARLLRTLINESENIYGWVRGMMKPEDFFTDEPRRYVGSMTGRQVKIMRRRCDELGVRILTSTAAKKLLQDENGCAAGVVAEDKDGQFVAEAGKIIIGTGGFMGDEELMKRYLPNWDETTMDDFCFMGHTYSGDGIRMAFEIGAADDGTVSFECDPNKTVWTGNAKTPCRDFFNTMTNNGFVWISKNGVRFCDESKINATNSMYRLPGKICWLVFDSAYMEHVLAQEPFRPWLYPHASFEKMFARQLEMGYTVKADTWEELAELIGCPPEKLRETMDEYNADCAAGYDRWFCKPPETMFPMLKPPFYANKSPMPMLVTRGPLKVSCDMELLDKNDHPIPGFYAVGVDIGGTDSDTYAAPAPSHSSLFSVASGRIAARHAAKNLK